MKKYYGNKNIPGIIQKIINRIPKHDCYIELFAGGAATGNQLPITVPHYYFDPYPEVQQFHLHYSSDNYHFINSPWSLQLQLLQFLQSNYNSFIFCDPPYLHSTRNLSRTYAHELTESDHLQFLKYILTVVSKVMIIHPRCELYDDALQSWQLYDVKLRYQNKTSNEGIWTNYIPANTELQTYKFAGNDCWQRQQFKRKATRLAQLPQLPLDIRNPWSDIL